MLVQKPDEWFTIYDLNQKNNMYWQCKDHLDQSVR